MIAASLKVCVVGGVALIAVAAGCRTTAFDISGAHYVGRGRASLELLCAGLSASLGKDAKWDGIRLNELGKSGNWSLDFNDVVVDGGVTVPARAYVHVGLPTRPAVGMVRAKITCEIWKPERMKGERLVSTTTSRAAEVVFDEANLAVGGALAGRVSFTGSDVRVQGRFQLRLEEPPPLFPVGH